MMTAPLRKRINLILIAGLVISCTTAYFLVMMQDELHQGFIQSIREGTPQQLQYLLKATGLESESKDSLPGKFLFIVLISYISEDIACLIAGLLAATGEMSFFAAVVASMLGLFTGDVLVFLGGRFLGTALSENKVLRWFVAEESIEKARHWFSHRGPLIIFLCRFVPGTRLPVYLLAGGLRLGMSQFIFYTLAGITVWTPALVYASMLVGPSIAERFKAFQVGAVLAVLALALVLWVGKMLARKFADRRSRAILGGKIRRILEWEFWPAWAAYIPVVFYLVFLSIKFRSLTAFTAANPAIPQGGVTGESKAAILEGLGDSLVASFALIPGWKSYEERHQLALDFLECHKPGFPVVLKPDSGQRGEGVRIIRSREELAAYLSANGGATVIQEYIPGVEFGIFYYRLPGEQTGRISSITEKVFPSVVGDGRSTLEDLVLADSRAVCTYSALRESLGSRMHSVPSDGERVALAELGSHCRGAIFLDGSRLLTPELQTRIDELSRGFDGFYFGRYDIRCAAIEDLRSGRDFRVIELNGVTAEAAHVYDPAVSLIEAYRVWFLHWRLAFEIGKRNMRAGASAAGIGELLGLAFDFLRGKDPVGAVNAG